MKKKILYGGLCLLLSILLGGFLFYCRKEEKQQIDESCQKYRELLIARMEKQKRIRVLDLKKIWNTGKP